MRLRTYFLSTGAVAVFQLSRHQMVSGQLQITMALLANEESDGNTEIANGVLNARKEIEAIAISSLETSGVNLAAKFLRLAFHDAVGGSDGCVDMSDGDNAGLDVPIDALLPLVRKYASNTTGLSRADIWALAGLVGAEISQEVGTDTFVSFPLYFYGRVDCDAVEGATCINIENKIAPCSETTASYHPLPSPDLTTHEILSFFADTFAFSTRETVVAMGAHTLGVAKRENSGFNGQVGWVDGRDILDNEYYRLLVGGGSPRSDLSVLTNDALFWGTETQNNQDLPDQKNRFVWVRRSEEKGNAVPLIMLTSDIALVRDLDKLINPDTKAVTCSFRDFGSTPNVCPHAAQTLRLVAEFKHDNSQWIHEFQAVLSKMFTTGYDTGHDCDPLVSSCLRLVDAFITWPPSVAPTSKPTSAPVVNTIAPNIDTQTHLDDPDSATSSSSRTSLLAWAALVTVAVVLL